MTRRITWVALLLATVIAFAGCAATREGVPGDVPYDEAISYMYGGLAPYGAWVGVAPYGLVWCPDGVSSAWAPYTVGYWMYTDEGWFWAAEDPWGPWGWVPYHYGRWAFDDYYGWVWVPDDVWAPAWVAWRYDSDWVGWAPLPPDVSWQINIGIELTSSDLDRRIPYPRWSFMRALDFGTHRKRVHVERSDLKETLWKETRNITKYAAGPRPVEVGMSPDLLRAIGGKKIERYRITDATKPVAKDGLRIRGRQLEVFRPTVDRDDVVRERSRAETQQKGLEPGSSTIDRVRGEERVKPGVQVAAREQGIRERAADQNRRPENKAPDQREAALDQPGSGNAGSRLREQVAEQKERVVKERERQSQTKHEEVARQREETERQAEVARQREDAARERNPEVKRSEDQAKDTGKPEVHERRETRGEVSRERRDELKGRDRRR